MHSNEDPPSATKINKTKKIFNLKKGIIKLNIFKELRTVPGTESELNKYQLLLLLVSLLSEALFPNLFTQLLLEFELGI